MLPETKRVQKTKRVERFATGFEKVLLSQAKQTLVSHVLQY
jgi:hypothetical protein